MTLNSYTCQLRQAFLEFASAYKYDLTTDGDGEFVSRSTEAAYIAFEQGADFVKESNSLACLESSPLIEPIVWIDASQELPDSGLECFVCFERNDCESRDTCEAVFDDSHEGESPWEVDGGMTHFGTVMFWAEKPVGPARGQGDSL